MPGPLKDRIKDAAIAFRGYNVTNLGKSPELLAHPRYGPFVEAELRLVSTICSDALGRSVDLVERVRQRMPSNLASFPDDVGMTVAISSAQLEILQQCFGVPVDQVRLSFGYSIGELNSLLLGKVFGVEEVLPVPVSLAADCAELAHDVTMGILFTRGPVLEFDVVRRLCVEVSTLGQGIIGPSAHLSPNTILLLGQGDTLDRIAERMDKELPEGTHLRRNSDKWPPLHTPLVWQKSIPDRSALKLHRAQGGLVAPSPKVLSCVTGKASYNDFNSREHLVRWTDHPQLLWDVIYETLSSGVELVLHVGPEPNLIPATFNRIAANVSLQLGKRFLNGIGRHVISSLARQTWLTSLLSSQTALLRAPFVDHVLVEDWLLEQPIV